MRRSEVIFEGQRSGKWSKVRQRVRGCEGERRGTWSQKLDKSQKRPEIRMVGKVRGGSSAVLKADFRGQRLDQGSKLKEMEGVRLRFRSGRKVGTDWKAG